MKYYYLLFCFISLTLTGTAQTVAFPADRLILIQQYLDQQKDFSGIILIGASGEIKYNQGFGFTDRSHQVPFTGESLYTIGSITKSFTATAILKLMEEGKLDPADPIDRYLEDVPPDKKGITIHHLLTHSAGFPGALGDDYEAISAREFQNITWKQPLLFLPGQGYEYSNVGYSLLGIIIEVISGKSYTDFLREKIFDPAGMKTAGYRNSNADYQLLAHGYMQDGTDWGTSHDKSWNGPEPYWHLKANGGLLMSGTDMFQWYLALREHSVLSSESLKLQTTPHVDEGQGSYYGYGYAVDPSGEVVQHNGGNRIFKADFRWFPKADMFFFSATNDANVRLFKLNDEILQILHTGELPPVDHWLEVSREIFPFDENQYTSLAFWNMIQDYSKENAEAFIPEYCSDGMIERNGYERLYQLFRMLHLDAASGPVEAVYVSGENVRLVLAAREEPAKLKITLRLKAHKIDGLLFEMEGS